MYRLVVLVLLFSQWMMVQPFPVLAQVTSDAEAAAIVAVELSVLEASSDFNSLYDRIHPDAHAEIPRAAVVGWFQNEFAPRGPGVSTVTGVNFVSWTWPVTGRTYPYTAEVSFTQPFGNGTVFEDVVRLVQDQNGEWRWFFGRSREFVDEQIAKYVPAVPVQTQNQSIVDAVIEDIDTYWTMSFAAAGRSYVSPRVVDISQGGSSSCGYFARIRVLAFIVPEIKQYMSRQIFLVAFTRLLETSLGLPCYEGSGWSSGITSVYVSIHRFDSASSAVNALEYSLNDQIVSTGAWEVSVAPIGETTRALATSSDITIYAQQGNVSSVLPWRLRMVPQCPQQNRSCDQSLAELNSWRR